MSEQLRRIPTLLCLDVDGTIVSPDGVPYAATAPLLRHAALYGAQIALCSARPLISLQRLAEDVGNVTFLSALQGAVIAEFKYKDRRSSEAEIVRTEPGFGSRLIQRIHALLKRRHDVEIWYFGLDRWYVREWSAFVDREVEVTHVKPAVLESAEVDRVINKITIASQSLRELRSIEVAVRSLAVHVSRSGPHQLEMIPANQPEDKGVSILRRRMGLACQVIGIGDSHNDLGMLRGADIAVTFANAPPALRAAADVIVSEAREKGLRECQLLVSGRTHVGGRSAEARTRSAQGSSVREDRGSRVADTKSGARAARVRHQPLRPKSR